MQRKPKLWHCKKEKKDDKFRVLVAFLNFASVNNLLLSQMDMLHHCLRENGWISYSAE